MKLQFRMYKKIKKSGLFDSVYYLINNRDVRVADMDPIAHYIRYGWKEGRNPSEKFNTSFYLNSNPDVKESGKNPLLHYIEVGSKQGRLPHPPDNHPMSEYNDSESRIFGENISINTYPRSQSMTEIGVKEIVDKKISIIIPTKNAGPDFAFLMKVLRLQKGFKEIEIIIVDSGSNDETIEIAENYDATIVKIDPSVFSHSFARNLGAEEATGDYLLFTVQDALPPSSTWLYEMFQVIKDQNVVAVSCAETPREDADLFYRQISWNNYNFLGVNDRDRIFSLPERLDNESLRKNGQLSDLANLISKEIFDQYHYRFGYAEDLDLGIRLIKDGYKIAFLGSVRIIHSHNRLPYYFLKRGYVVNQFLSNIFNDFVMPKISMPSFVPDIAFTYVFLIRLIKYINNLPEHLTPELFGTKVNELFSMRYDFEYPGELPAISEQYMDEQTKEFLEDIIITSGFKYAGQKYDGFLTTAFLGYVNIVINYLKNTYETIDDLLLVEIKECFYKAFSTLVGTHLAYCNQNRTGEELQDMDKMHSLLMEGV